MTTKLSLYNNALVKHLGERKLGSLTENRKPRRVLDTVWDADFVRGVLEDGLWNFATRTYYSTYNPSIEPDFGFKYAHDKPEDWVRTSAISINEYFYDPMIAYNDEAGYFWCDHSEIYVRQISDDVLYGGDLTGWPESVVDYAELKLASGAVMALTQSITMADKIEAKTVRALDIAKSRDAAGDPPKFTPRGSWSRARGGRWTRGISNTVRSV